MNTQQTWYIVLKDARFLDCVRNHAEVIYVHESGLLVTARGEDATFETLRSWPQLASVIPATTNSFMDAMQVVNTIRRREWMVDIASPEVLETVEARLPVTHVFHLTSTLVVDATVSEATWLRSLPGVRSVSRADQGSLLAHQ